MFGGSLLLRLTKPSKTKQKAKLLLGCLLATSFALTFATASAQAKAEVTISAQKISAYQAASETERINILIRLAKSGMHEQAAVLKDRFPLQGPHAANRILFIDGLILVGRGDLTGACKKYRAALANDPKLTVVRTELANALATLGENDSAKYHLKLLAADAPNESEANGIRGFINQLDADTPFKAGGYVSVAPSTNINNGSAHEKVYLPFLAGGSLDPYGTIDAANRQKSGVGLSFGGNIGYAKRLGNYWQAVLAADVGVGVYSDAQFDSVNLSQSAELRYHLDQGYFGFGLVSSQSAALSPIIALKPQISYLSYGPRVSFNYDITQRDNVFASAVYEWRDYLGGTTELDGSALLADVSWNHAIDQSLSISLSGGYNKVNAEVQWNGYSTIYAGLGVNKDLPFGVSVNANAQARFSVFDAIGPSGYAREDQRYIGSITLVKRDLNLFGFAPGLNYTYTLNNCNISLWDYDSHAIDFRLTKNF
jgi:outer membrane protein